MVNFKKFTSGTLIYAIRLRPERRKDWLLKIFEQGGEKQAKKSAHQLWQYNNHLEEVHRSRTN
jgi:hypothetical protein